MELLEQRLGVATEGELACPGCRSERLHFVAHPDDPEEIFNDFIRCDICGAESDYYEFYKAWRKKYGVVDEDN